MNLLFFLTPKSDVTYVRDDYTLAKAIEILEKEHYTAIPVINKKGKYVGTLTEGDVLWTIKNDPFISFENAEEVKLSKIKRKKDNYPVNVNAKPEELMLRAIDQNFVPVIDDDDIFIGIVTRRDILRHYSGVQQ